jgi:hypothetical protein
VSKFQSLLDVANDRQPPPQPKPPPPKKRTPKAPPAVVETKRRGRPSGKRSDPDFEQVTAYIRRDTHKDVKIALLRDDQGREFSELVEELLVGWLKSRT